jgi:hypothetical protein
VQSSPGLWDWSLGYAQENAAAARALQLQAPLMSLLSRSIEFMGAAILQHVSPGQQVVLANISLTAKAHYHLEEKRTDLCAGISCRQCMRGLSKRCSRCEMQRVRAKIVLCMLLPCIDAALGSGTFAGL